MVSLNPVPKLAAAVRVHFIFGGFLCFVPPAFRRQEFGPRMVTQIVNLEEPELFFFSKESVSARFFYVNSS